MKAGYVNFSFDAHPSINLGNEYTPNMEILQEEIQID